MPRDADPREAVGLSSTAGGRTLFGTLFGGASGGEREDEAVKQMDWRGRNRRAGQGWNTCRRGERGVRRVPRRAETEGGRKRGCAGVEEERGSRRRRRRATSDDRIHVADKQRSTRTRRRPDRAMELTKAGLRPAQSDTATEVAPGGAQAAAAGARAIHGDIDDDDDRPPPPLPARSPLRPRPSSSKPPPSSLPLPPPPPPTTTKTATGSSMPSLLRSASLADLLTGRSSSSALANHHHLSASSALDLSKSASGVELPVRAPSPRVSLPLSLEASRPPDTNTNAPSTPGRSKRQHALLELLSSERAYASDLALVRELYMPAALGTPSPPFPLTPPASSSSSSSTSTTSSESTAQPAAPMTPADVRIIFGNIAELALFADTLSSQLQHALGDLIDGGTGPDTVGALFLSCIPRMRGPYTTYITHHPVAVEHLASLPPSPALKAYLARARASAAAHSHAWDLPSLLIKPVQRFLKYALLLGAILESTSPAHPDAENLRRARDGMQQAARAVNAAQRAREVVRDALAMPVDALVAGYRKRSKIGVPVGKGKAKVVVVVPEEDAFHGEDEEEGVDGAEQDARIDAFERELRDTAAFCDALARDAAGWAAGTRVFVRALAVWAASFGRAIGVREDSASGDGDGEANRDSLASTSASTNDTRASGSGSSGGSGGGSEAYDAFVDIAEREFDALCAEAERAVREDIAPALARVRTSTDKPLRVLDAMRALAPAPGHRATSAAAALLLYPSAPTSTSGTGTGTAEDAAFRALRSTLARELPPCVALVRSARERCVGAFVRVQSALYGGVRARWGMLWDALSVEGERRDAGAEETCKVWGMRMEDVVRDVARLGVVRHVEKRAGGGGGGVHGVGEGAWGGQVRRRASAEGAGSARAVEELHALLPRYSSRKDKPSPAPRKRSTSRKKSSSDAHPPSSPVVPTSFADASSNGNGDRNANGTTSSSSSPPRLRVSAKWQTAPAKYTCAVVHACEPPPGVAYYGLPFFRLRRGDTYDVLKEAGHPSAHEDLPLYVDDGDDCLLLARDRRGELGWALASFLYPVEERQVLV